MKIKKPSIRLPFGGAKRLPGKARHEDDSLLGGPAGSKADDALQLHDEAGAQGEGVDQEQGSKKTGRGALRRQSMVLLPLILAAFGGAVVAASLNAKVNEMSGWQAETIAGANMYAQRLAKAANMAVLGDHRSFEEIDKSVEALSAASGALVEGGPVGDHVLDAVPDGSPRAAARQFQAAWAEASPLAILMLYHQESLESYATAVRGLRENTAAFSQAIREIVAKLPKDEVGAKEAQYFLRLSVLVETIASETGRLAMGGEITERDAPRLKAFTDLLLAQFDLGRNAPTYVPAAKGKAKPKDAKEVAAIDSAALLGEASHRFLDLEADRVTEIVNQARESIGLIPPAMRAALAANHLYLGSQSLSQVIENLQTEQRQHREKAELLRWATMLSGLLGVIFIALLGRAFYKDSIRRAKEAEERRLEAERQEADAKRVNDQSQAAILRLMNELQDVADGDLTVQATVSEDITGAIADSINYTVEELRDLVQRINSTAGQVTSASGTAQAIATRLQGASEHQSREIRDTGASVLSMAAQIKQVSASAGQSANVARQSLAAADRGHQAVQNAIAGMNGIRDHIQETAKRIKRLGESSQEIGEIVELISDITEQTNVLALNAAIQAASAGEAGRGFTVVAEEVQKLAERSAEATRQISGLIKTIQTDTHDAVAAMERSTQGVVLGTKLSDQAGTALVSIGKVSRELSDLILRISQTTQKQAESAEGVAASMQRILETTEQTSQGTQQTASSVRELSELANELKNSVSRFRVA